MEFDEVLKVIGEFGRTQKLHFALINLLQIFFAFHMILLAFVGKEPSSVACKGRPAQDACKAGVPTCEEYEYGPEFTSIATEWDLVCSEAYKAGLSQSVFMAGVLVGASLFGILADMYGRKFMTVIGCVLMAVFGSISALSHSYVQFTTLRFFSGISTGGTILVSFVLATETLGPATRAPAGSVMTIGFAVGILCYALLAYLIRSWRWLTAIVSFPLVVHAISFYCIIPESPRWLASKGRVSEAEDILYDIGRRNGMEITKAQVCLTKPKEGDKPDKQYQVMDCFRTPELRKRMLINILMWFSCSMVYYGLTMNASNLGDNMYISVALSGLVEIPAYLACLFYLNKLGRKRMLCGALLLGGAACLVFTVLPEEVEESNPTVGTALAMIGKLGISAAFNIIYIYCSELLPTVLRNSGMGICSMSARLGGIVAPSVIPMGDFLAYLIFGSFAFISGLFSLRLPETLNQPLPETIEDVETAPSPTEFAKIALVNDDNIVQAVEEKLNLLDAEENLQV